MSATLSLRAALRRGALVTAANWPVVLVELGIESLYKLTLAVPVIGGSLMVAALVGADLGEVVSEGVGSTADAVFRFLVAAPAALMSFLVALGLVALGGEIIMFVVKGATLHVLVRGERRAGDLHRGPIDLVTLRSAQAFSLEALLDGGRRYGRRAVTLALALGAAYAIIGSLYVVAVTGVFGRGFHRSVIGGWPLVVLLSTSAGVIGVTMINLAYDLVRVIVLTDDCRVGVAVSRLRRFLVHDARQVIGIFAVMWAVGLLATAVAILATGGMTLIATMPFLGLLVVPLQAAAWLIRGLLFQYLSLASLSAYQTQYRRFSETTT